MQSRVHLCVYRDLTQGNSPQTLVSLGSAPLPTDNKDNFVIVSVSPIFPCHNACILPEENSTYKIEFIVHKNPFTELGKLDEDHRKHVWFSLGITSIIIITPAAFDTSSIHTLLGEKDNFLCVETWTVQDRILISSLPSVPCKLGDGAIPNLAPEMPVHPDLKRAVKELELNFDALARKAFFLMPSLLPTINEMVVAVEREIKKMIKHETALPHSVDAECSLQELEEVHLTTHKHVNLSLDYIVQLNSALAYILSQSFYGGPPLLLNRALHSLHSMLGLGTAMRAIQQLTEFIISGFAKYPVAKVLKHHFRHITLKQFFSSPRHDNPRRLDAFFEEDRKEPQTPKLAYFSSRMGFSEHGFCVTAATQCLAAADSPRKNLMTLSHELLHSHVRGLLAVILGGSSGANSPDERPLELVQEYKTMGPKREANAEWTIAQFLRFRIFELPPVIGPKLGRG